MNGYRYGHRQDTGKGSRGRLVLLVLLPTAFLGVTYFLFIEYLLQGLTAQYAGIQMTARAGGAVLVTLSIIVATAVGYLLLDRILRPLRVLVRLVQGGDVPDSGRMDPETRCREMSELYRVVGTLVRQNQAGAKALEELEGLRTALATFREEIGRTGQHGILPRLAEATNGPLAAISEHIQRNRSQLVSFFSDLRDRVQAVKAEVNSLAEIPVIAPGGRVEQAAISRGNPHFPGQLPESDPSRMISGQLSETETAVNASIERLRRLGTVLTLDAGASVRADGSRVGRHLESYLTELADLERAQVALTAALRGEADRVAASAAAEAAHAAAEATSMDNRLLNNEIKDRLRRLLDSLESLDRRLGEVEDR